MRGVETPQLSKWWMIMIFNESNVKVINENGYLSKYAGIKAPYFPFTKDDVKNNIIIIHDSGYYDGAVFYQTNYKENSDVIYFMCFTSLGVRRLNFNFNTMTIIVNDFKWSSN